MLKLKFLSQFNLCQNHESFYYCPSLLASRISMLEQSAAVTVWECLTIYPDCWRPLLRNPGTGFRTQGSSISSVMRKWSVTCPLQVSEVTASLPPPPPLIFHHFGHNSTLRDNFYLFSEKGTAIVMCTSG